jgi:hypothetical protein
MEDNISQAVKQIDWMKTTAASLPWPSKEQIQRAFHTPRHCEVLTDFWGNTVIFNKSDLQLLPPQETMMHEGEGGDGNLSHAPFLGRFTAKTLTFMWCGTNPNAANQYFVPPPPQPNSSDCASAQHGPNGCKNCIQEWTQLGTEEDEDGIQRRFLLTKGNDRRIYIDAKAAMELPAFFRQGSWAYAATNTPSS